ncbi:MAG: caspase family protein [Burkholderiales bacterium]
MALVIGNARYPTMPLTNPENDARVVAATLRRLGFDVSEHVNLGVKEFRKVLRDYARRVENEDGASVFYYAGHGVQIEGRNYLLPVDINLRDEYEIRDEGVDIDEIYIGRLERARSQVRIVILDACRDNPFSTRSRATRGAGGLAEMAARGALIAYATAPGATAEDGPPGTNSVFTRHLAKELLTEGVEVEQMFKSVRVKVMRDTHERQVPWVNTSMTRNFSFNPARAGTGDDAAKREDLARLQALLDQREKDQKKLEDQLEQMARQLAESQRKAGVKAAAEAASVLERPSASPATTAIARPIAPIEIVAPAAPIRPPAATAALSAPSAPSALAPAASEPTGAAAQRLGLAPEAPNAGADATATAATYEAAKAWMAARARPAARPPTSLESVAIARPRAEPPTPALERPSSRQPERPPAPPEPALASADSSIPTSHVALSRPAGHSGPSGNASELCVALLIRAQLGEAVRPADMAFLKKECR